MTTYYQQKQISDFKHWTRKSYAIFNSLKLQIKISTLSVAMLLISFVQTATAQKTNLSTNSEEYNLDTLEVMGELTPELEIELARQVQVVEAASLELNSVQSLQDILNSVSQIDLRQRGKNDIQADLSIRGSTFNQVQVLLNGFDMSDPQTGHHSLNLPIAFSQISRIEVLSGPGSRVLGSNAYAGAVNFVTPKVTVNRITLQSTFGDFGLMEYSAGLQFKKKRISHFVSANYSSSKGYIANTDFKHHSIFYFGDLQMKNSNLSLQMAYSDKAFGANSFYTPKFPNQYEQLRNLFAGVKYKTKGKISTLTYMHYRANADRFELFRDNDKAPAWYQHHNFHFNQVFQLNTKAWVWWKFGKTVAAANVRSEEIYSNVLGNELIDTIIPFFNSAAFYNKYDKRLYSTMSVEHIYRWEKLKIAAGLMYYYYQDDANSGFFPGIDMSYKINSKIKLYAGINTGMRLPTFTDLYYSGPSNIGNSSLKAESQIAYQVGTKLKTKLFELDLQLYINDAHNSIDWVRKADTLKWQPMNITSVQSYGGDFSLEIFTRNIGLKWIQKLSFKYSYLDKNSNSPDFQSHYIMDYLKHKFVMNIQHKIYENLSMGYVFHYHNRVGEFQKYDSQTRTFSNKEYSPYALFDMRLMWKYKQFKVFADISNVFDVQYFDYGNLPQAGRWFTLGVKTRIGL